MQTATTSSTRSLGPIATVALAGALGVSALATFGGEQKQDQVDTYWIVALFLVAVTGLIFALVVRPALTRSGSNNSAALSGLITSIAGILTIVAFWSGLPVVLGAAGAVMGAHGKNRAKEGAGRSGMATTAVVLGLLAAVGSAVLVVLEKMGI